jgi:subtilisin-like proprotein convertase family protein
MTTKLKPFAFLAVCLIALPLRAAIVYTYDYTTPLTLPGSGTSGYASVSPATVTAVGTLGTITDVELTLTGLSHSSISDMTFYLVGPNGDAGVWLFGELSASAGSATDVTLVFSDSAAGSIPFNPPGGLASGTYQPGNPYGSPSLPSGDPPATSMYGSFLAAFGGSTADGSWSLYAWDDSIFDTGTLDSWHLSVSTDAPGPPGGVGPGGTPEPSTGLAALLTLTGLAFFRRRRR